MPVGAIAKLAKKAGVSVKKAETAWESAKKKAKESGRIESDPRFYGLVTTITRNILGIKEGDSGRLQESYEDYLAGTKSVQSLHESVE